MHQGLSMKPKTSKSPREKLYRSATNLHGSRPLFQSVNSYLNFNNLNKTRAGLYSSEQYLDSNRLDSILQPIENLKRPVTRKLVAKYSDMEIQKELNDFFKIRPVKWYYIFLFGTCKSKSGWCVYFVQLWRPNYAWSQWKQVDVKHDWMLMRQYLFYTLVQYLVLRLRQSWVGAECFISNLRPLTSAQNSLSTETGNFQNIYSFDISLQDFVFYLFFFYSKLARVSNQWSLIKLCISPSLWALQWFEPQNHKLCAEGIIA